MTLDNDLIVALSVPGMGLAAAWVTARFTKRGERENAVIDQIQEERGEDRKRLDKLEAEVGELRMTVVTLVSRDHHWRYEWGRVAQQVRDLGAEPHPLPAVLQKEPPAPHERQEIA